MLSNKKAQMKKILFRKVSYVGLLLMLTACQAVWDVVLTDLKPGKHTIHGSAKMGTDSYRWIIHLAIVDNDPGMGMPWAGPGTQDLSSLSK
jgi:hypothetical protein